MHIVDFIAKVVLSALAGAFIAGVIASMAVLAYAFYRDFLVRDEYDSFDLGPHGRNALTILKPWFRRLILVWVGALSTGLMWILMHILFAT